MKFERQQKHNPNPKQKEEEKLPEKEKRNNLLNVAGDSSDPEAPVSNLV
jgi:hypothetical protein